LNAGLNTGKSVTRNGPDLAVRAKIRQLALDEFSLHRSCQCGILVSGDF
jgi:hypothetical protein